MNIFVYCVSISATAGWHAKCLDSSEVTETLSVVSCTLYFSQTVEILTGAVLAKAMLIS